MDAKGAEIQIREKLGVIGTSIASFVNAEQKAIYEKLSKLNFYVYDDYYAQKSRLINIDLYRIAYEYSNDVIEELILDNDREEEILELRFGLNGKEEFTQKEVADMIGISQSYISRLEKKIISKLKKELEKTYSNNILETFNKSSFVTEHDVQYVLEFKDFFTPVEECIRRDAMRSNPIGEKTIKDIWRRYRHFIQTTKVEQYVDNLIAFDLSKPFCVVIDMDSTMCFNMTKRPWYGEGSTEAMLEDTPNYGVCEIVRVLADKYPIVVATGRDTTQKEVTLQWLERYGVTPTEGYFRTPKDFRVGSEIKKEQILSILEKYNVLAIFEDCEPIVQMYRDMGLTVLQPNKGA